MGFLSSIFGGRDGGAAPDATPPQAEAFTNLRQQALALRAGDLRIPNDTGAPLAVLMETGYPGAVATLVAVADGAVSLYFSNGGGVIGAGEHAPVREAGGGFLQAASGLAAEMTPADEHPVPAEGRVRFYMVMEDGVRTAEADQDDLGHQRHALSPLFFQGHAVLTAVRESTPDAA